MEERNYYVYEWYNEETGEVIYVGKGKGNRYKDKNSRNQYFIKYTNKHKCKPRIIVENLTEDEAYQKEKELIAYYRKKGQVRCNINDGGEDPPTMYGKDNPISRAVVQLTLDGKFVKEWESIKQAAEALGISDSPISSCCIGKYGRKSYGGFLWVYKEKYDKNKKYKYAPGSNERPIIQFDLNGNFIKEWKSAVEIEEKLGYRRSSICSVCKGIYNTSNGYIWRYKSEVGDIKKIKVKKGRSPVPIVQLDLDGNYIATFKNGAEAAKHIGVNTNSHIIACCNRKINTAYGYKWMYEHEYKKKLEECKNLLFA